MSQGEIIIVTQNSLRTVGALRQALAHADAGAHVMVLNPRREFKLLASNQQTTVFEPDDFRAHFRAVSLVTPSGKDTQMGAWHSFEPRQAPSSGKIWTWAMELDHYGRDVNAYIPFSYKNFKGALFGKPKRMISGNNRDGFNY